MVWDQLVKHPKKPSSREYDLQHLPVEMVKRLMDPMQWHSCENDKQRQLDLTHINGTDHIPELFVGLRVQCVGRVRMAANVTSCTYLVFLCL